MELRMTEKLNCNNLINVLAIIFVYILSETIFWLCFNYFNFNLIENVICELYNRNDLESE